MNKKPILILAIILIALFVLLKNCADPFANHLPKKQIIELVIQNEDLIRTALEEIQGLPYDILSVSTTEKMKIYESEYEHIQGLYICRKVNEQIVYEHIENDVFKKVMELEGLIKISVWHSMIEFYCGGRGFGTATSYYGFTYYTDPIISESTHFSPEYVKNGDGWLQKEKDDDNSRYTEKIKGNFYYYEEHY